MGADFILIYRISLIDLIPDGSSWPEVVQLAQAVTAAGATILNTGIGWHEARIPTIATSVPRAAFAWVTKKLRDELRAQGITIPLVTSNRINTPEVAERVLTDGSADLVSLARPFLADPDFVAKAAAGRADEINTCIACNQACLDHTFKNQLATCLVNPRAGHETTLRIRAAPQARRVAVVGAGPAGLSVARELATKGYRVTVFDRLPYAGGTMLIGVPAFRLPREAIEMDVRLVERLGVRFVFNTEIGVDITFDQLQKDYDAIAITAGAMNAVVLDVPGADLEGVQYGVDFMKKANLGQPLTVGRDVVVIGGGYTAMDCSRTSLRHGADNVAIVYRRTRSELVVDEEELGETEREGVRMEFLASPVEVLGEDGHVTGVKFIRNRLGEPDASGRRSPVPIEGSEFVNKADTVIPAVSQAADLTFLPVESSFEINRGRVKVDPATYATNVRGVFACGDFVTGPTTLIEAAGHGKKAAYAIDRYLAARTDVTVSANVKITSSWRHEMPELYDVLPRQHIPMAPLAARMPSTDPEVNFTTPVELGYDATAAVAESTRCLMCNFNIWFDPFRCVLCGACADVCPEGVIHMVDVNQLKTEGLLPEIEEAYGWDQGAAMILDEERCIRCALCVQRCPFDAITMERFELQEISTDGRLYKESYRDAQLAGTPGVAGGAR